MRVARIVPFVGRHWGRLGWSGAMGNNGTWRPAFGVTGGERVSFRRALPTGGVVEMCGTVVDRFGAYCEVRDDAGESHVAGVHELSLEQPADDGPERDACIVIDGETYFDDSERRAFCDAAHALIKSVPWHLMAEALAKAAPTQARDQNAGADFDRGVYVAAKLAVDISTGYAGDDPRSRALMDFVECLFQYYPGGKRARDTEEALAKARRDASRAWAAGRARGYQLKPEEIEAMDRQLEVELGSAGDRALAKVEALRAHETPAERIARERELVGEFPPPPIPNTRKGTP